MSEEGEYDVKRFKERVTSLSEQVKMGLLKAAGQYEELVKRADEHERTLTRIRQCAGELDDSTKMLIWLSNKTLAEDLGFELKQESE